MKKRDYIEEITSIKDRSKFPGRFELMSRFYEIDSIIYDLMDNGNLKNKEILKYIPIATVACFESFFRSIVAELIDKGEPYNQNVLKFNQSNNIRFDFNIVNAIQKKKISIGDFISHILSCNNIKDFNSNLSILTQLDFLEELKKFEPKSISKPTIDTAKLFKEKTSVILESIDYIFRLRHIFCHEFATNIELEYLVIKGTYEHCKIFLFHVNDFIWNLLEPDAPLTQTEMNIRAGENYIKAESELTKVIEEIKNLDLSDENIYLDRKGFELVIQKWKEYREVKADAFAKHSKGGTIYPLLRLNSLKATTEKMTAELIEEYGLNKASR
ncbi:lysozyme inhibitor LprI family protein [Jejuia pallidilutea]|uniref:Lysozyme inhibitor LprI-like N-terminal domain-containing protein n=1 Tax=Jejuia pallidilutea TaxID=504487 RepID=A0A090X120_9FLAO|nr:lysozyme inhibitor LprI family protein [Jejuia pallidilutea]GAL73427.1 hypothetical protein JCM19302_3364 [Jejuia pallidilutea]GAL89739.1 hypothetical protein JCM19538_746 [Jejuia pallidilutea]